MFHVVHKPLNYSEQVQKLHFNIPYTYHMQNVQDSLETLLCMDFSISKKKKKQLSNEYLLKKRQQT